MIVVAVALVLIGVDPLASSKGFWAEILGVGDFYYELGIVIVQVRHCLFTFQASLSCY